MKTQNYNLNLIDKTTDKIFDSLDGLNENFEVVDEEFYKKENDIFTLKQKLEKAEAILPTQISSGENVYINNAQNYPIMSLIGEGKSVQEVEPTPENPQEIKVINETSYIGIGSNFYNVNDVTKKTEGITVDEDGWITATYDNTNGTSTKFLNFHTSNLKIQEATQYAIFTEIKSVSGNGTLLPISTDWKTPPNEGQFRQDLKYTFSSVSNGAIKKTIQTSESNFSALKQIGLRSFVQFATGESGSITFRLSVIKDTNVTSESFAYEPYKESTVAIDLKGNELASVGTVSDKLLIDRKGNVAIEKNVGKVVLDGSEDEGWIAFNENLTNVTGYMTKTYLIDANSNELVSNYFKNYTADTLWKKDVEGIAFVTSTKYIAIYISKSKTSLKTWLQENNTTVYYKLSTPEIINLGTIENPQIFKGINNITVETNLGNMQIEAEYVEDLQARISKIEQAIVAQGGI